MVVAEDKARHWMFLGAILAQLSIFVLSLPGFGIETRKPSDYSAWAGPLFLALTILVFLLGAGAIVALRNRMGLARMLGVGQAVSALLTNFLDLSHIGGAAPPGGPLALGVVSILVAFLTLYAAWCLLCPPPEPTPPTST